MFLKNRVAKFILVLAIMILFATDGVVMGNVQPIKRITIVQMVEHPALNATRRGILDELQNKGVTIEFQSAQGNSALATQIAQKFVGTYPDVMVGIGTTPTQALISANRHHSIPIVFSSVTDPKSAKIIKNLNAPEGEVTGVSNFVNPEQQFDFFKKVLPHLSTVGVIYNPGEANSVMLIEEMKKISAHKGLQLVLATACTTADVVQATQKLIPKVQALFINNDNTALSAFDSIINISNKYKIPVFCSDLDMIDQGALAALGANQYEIGKQTGQLILNILRGERPSQIPVVFPNQTETRINMVQATKLGIKVPE